MKRKFTSRDLKFFLLGLFTMFVIDLALNWNESVEAMKQGYRDGSNQANGVTNPINE